MAGAWARAGIVRIAAATAAVFIGCVLLVQAGAPASMPSMNAAAVPIGLALLALVRIAARLGAPAADAALVVAALAIPLTALLGPAADGVSRWLIVGGITIQPALIIAPLLVIGLASRPTIARSTAVAVAAAGVALQPDPAAAAMLFCGIAAGVVAGWRARPALAALGFAAAALVVAVGTAPTLPPAPFAEGVIVNALSSGLLSAALALLSLALLFAPALVPGPGERRLVAIAFVGVWAAAVLASLLGNYPTPVVGYGGSAIVGYVLSVGMLNWSRDRATSTARREAIGSSESDTGSSLRFA